VLSEPRACVKFRASAIECIVSPIGYITRRAPMDRDAQTRALVEAPKKLSPA